MVNFKNEEAKQEMSRPMFQLIDSTQLGDESDQNASTLSFLDDADEEAENNN